jgi:hypothetical protein
MRRGVPLYWSKFREEMTRLEPKKNFAKNEERVLLTTKVQTHTLFSEIGRSLRKI